MSAIQPPAKILFTGANGYFATYAIKDLLERGYEVVGTVRSASKGEELVKLHSRFGDRFNYAIVPDIIKAGAFDEVIRQGEFDGVAHAASPVVATGSTPDGKAAVTKILTYLLTRRTLQDYIRPAVDGTIGILASIKQYGPTIKRVVLTSSALAAVQYQGVPLHTEAHWNEASIKIVEEKGPTATGGDLYTASKTYAEKAAWKFMEENKGAIGFDLVAILPSYILGTPIHPVASREQLTSTNMILSVVRKPRADSELGNTAFHIVHVRDMATIHSASFSVAEASGHRVFGIGSEPTWQDIYNALNEEPAFPNVPKGSASAATHLDSGSSSWDVSFSKKLLGRDFIGTKQAFRETEEYYQKKGWAFE
ncbi:methylglyoxal reductase (NADPH-dependent) gre2 [Ceratobasidium sp. 392]|nr:methylglyoxal reductase (NADPH-dependent) gre2 [Ceratobasidium sp. 392]